MKIDTLNLNKIVYIPYFEQTNISIRAVLAQTFCRQFGGFKAPPTTPPLPLPAGDRLRGHAIRLHHQTRWLPQLETAAVSSGNDGVRCQVSGVGYTSRAAHGVRK